MIKNKYILFAFRLIVGGVFIWAGLLKIFDTPGFAQSIQNYKVFPQIVSFFLALILPWVEVICGLLLVLGVFRYAGSLLISAMLAAFLILIFVTIFRGIDVDCGCFGTLSRKVDYKLILTDCVLLFLSLTVLFSSKTSNSVTP